MNVRIDKDLKKSTMKMKWRIHNVAMGDVIGLFGIKMDVFKFNDIAFDSTKLEEITFASASIEGILKPDETYQIVAKASVSNSKAFKSGDVYLVLTRNADEATKAALAIDIRDVHNIGEALEHLIDQHDFISDFGLLGRIERDCIIMLAKDDIVTAGESIDNLLSAFITPTATKMIPKGVNVRVKIPVKGLGLLFN